MHDLSGVGAVALVNPDATVQPDLLDHLWPPLEDEEGVGAHISVDHVASCKVGKTVRVRAELTEVDGRRVICKVEAFDGDRLLAEGRQVQVVMDKSKIKQMIERS